MTMVLQLERGFVSRWQHVECLEHLFSIMKVDTVQGEQCSHVSEAFEPSFCRNKTCFRLAPRFPSLAKDVVLKLSSQNILDGIWMHRALLIESLRYSRGNPDGQQWSKA